MVRYANVSPECDGLWAHMFGRMHIIETERNVVKVPYHSRPSRVSRRLALLDFTRQFRTDASHWTARAGRRVFRSVSLLSWAGPQHSRMFRSLAGIVGAGPWPRSRRRMGRHRRSGRRRGDCFVVLTVHPTQSPA